MSTTNAVRVLLCLLLLPTLAAAAGASKTDEGVLPRPAALERDVQFWIRVYTQVTTNEGFLHDENNLAVVYETLHFPANASPREREIQLDAAKSRYAALLRRLAGRPPDTELDPEERRVLDLWGSEATPARLEQASDSIRFQLGQADRFRAGLIRSGAWEAHIADSLANLGLPPEIAALPHVESSFNPAAYSKVGAAGLWQFMRATGRRYLRIDSVVDERLDPFRSTEAAAQLLAYNYRILGSWPLAITAYNHGAAGMRRARDTVGTDDIVAIARNYHGPAFGFASRNFYVSFLAALEIERNPEKYFGPIERVPEQHFREIPVPAYVPIAALEQALKVDRETLRALNPALESPVWDGQRFVPRGYRLRLPAQKSDWTAEKLAARLSPRDEYVGQIESRSHRVKRGETLESVAGTYGLTPKALAELNGIAVEASLRPGRTIRLPDRRPALVSGATLVAAAAAVPDGVGDSSGVYVVRRGEALSEIATRLKMSQADLIRFNHLQDSEFIFEGQKLRTTAESPTLDAEAELPATSPVAALPGGPPAPPQLSKVALSAAAPTRAPLDPVPVTLKAEPVSRSQADALGPSLVPGGAATPEVTDAVDYAVAPDGTVHIAAAETIGHYAEWLGVDARRLRALNHLGSGRSLMVGQRLRLDFSRVSHEKFEERRRDYHARLQTEFFDAHRIEGTEIYVARRGDSLWTVTQRYPRLPAWLLQEYNSDTDFSELRPGTQLVVPKVEEATAAN